MINFSSLTLDNWPAWKDYILGSEQAFPVHIRGTEEYFLGVLSKPGYMGRIAEIDGTYIGNTVGHAAACHTDVGLKEKVDGFSFDEGRIALVANIVIEPEYQKKGYSWLMLDDFIKEAEKKDFDKLVFFSRPDNSLPMARTPLAKAAGLREIRTCENWYDSGEDYVFCELDVKKARDLAKSMEF